MAAVAALTVDATITLAPGEAPLGAPVELRITGVDWQTYRARPASWQQ